MPFYYAKEKLTAKKEEEKEGKRADTLIENDYLDGKEA